VKVELDKIELEAGIIAGSSEYKVQVSQAISLKRIADSLEILVKQPASKTKSLFEEVFGR
jgi:hypothetical protein